MNFCDILVIVYLFGEFGCIKYVASSITVINNEVQIPNESREKKKQVEEAILKAADILRYRSSKEEPARIEATKQKNNFELNAHVTFTDVKPQQGRKAKRLWDKAKKAADNYETIKYNFDQEKFCNPLVSPNICARVFENPYFKNENLSYDPSIALPGNGCIKVPCTMQFQNTYTVQYNVEYKLCYAKRKNEDGTESALIVYLQSPFKQPIFGGYQYLVIFLYLFDETTQKWVRPPDPLDPTNTDIGKFRYEALLSL